MRGVPSWAIGLFSLFAVACAPAVGERYDDKAPPAAEAAGHNDEEIVFAPSDLSGFALVGNFAESRVIPADGPATRGGLLVDLWSDVGDATVGVEVRGVRADGSTTDWKPAEVTWHEAPHLVARADLGESVSATQIRIPDEQRGLIQNVMYSAVTPDELEMGDATGAASSGIGQTSQGLSSALVGLVQPRSAWNARATRCSTKQSSYYRMAIHHTFTPPSSSGGYAVRLRSIQAYHMDTRGWCDVGYEFLVTEDGKVWEGRPLDYLGAHVAGNNTGNVGLSWVGCYDVAACAGISSSNVPTQPSIEAAGHVMHELSTKYGIAPAASNVKGHSAHSGASTECPGDELIGRIPDLISMAATGSASTSPPPTSTGTSAPPPPPPTGPTGRVLGVAWDLGKTSSPSVSGNVRIAGASIIVDGGVGTTTRAGDALFNLTLAPGSHTLVASAPGYVDATETFTISSNVDTWASIGLQPATSAPPPVCGDGYCDASSESCASCATDCACGTGGTGGAGGSGGSGGTSSGGTGGSVGAGGGGGSGGTSSGGAGGSGGTSSGPIAAALDRAKAGVGFSYWWGHGRYLPQGPSSSTAGSCSGSCGSCSHSGSYGADCSGYVAKIWQVPSTNDDLTVDEHPYSTADFYSDGSQWSTVSRDNMQAADAMVYRSGSSGHIFLYDHGDAWGSLYAYECKGCSYGCVAGMRTASSAYHAIRRKGY